MAEKKYKVEIPDIEYYQRVINCQYACPVRTPAGNYVSAIAEKGYEKAKEFISFSKVIYLTKKIADRSIEIRREYKIKLPDAVIAATASSKNLTLVTRNDDDFKDIQYLEIYNPFE